MDYKKMSLEDLQSESDKLKAVKQEIMAKRQAVKDAMDHHFMVAKFDKMTDKEKQAMKIYVEGFKSNGEFGEVG